MCNFPPSIMIQFPFCRPSYVRFPLSPFKTPDRQGHNRNKKQIISLFEKITTISFTAVVAPPSSSNNKLQPNLVVFQRQQNMTMMEEELSFPRGGHHQRRSEPPNKEDNDNKRSRKEKRKSTEEGDAPSIKTDFLFGTKSKKNDEKSSSKRRKKDESTDVSGSSNKHSMLPLGGGGVVMSTKRLHTKKGSSSKDMITNTTAVTPVIEALSFSKFAKGTKVLACVRQVQDEFAIVSLPNLLTAYILPQDPFPLKHTLTVGQTLAVVIQKVATEQVKGGASRKRIQVTPLPQAVNPRSLLMGDDTHSSKASTLASAANRLSKSSIPVRGQIMSIEDHGCVVDLGFGARGFVKFEDIHEGDQNYVILEDDDEQEESQRDNEGEEKSTILLQKGRLYDFLVLPVSTSSSKEQSATVFPLCLPSTRKFADQTVSSLSPNASGSGRHKKSKDSTSSPVSLSSLTPGWLVQVKVEALATNGLCVSFFGNVFRGAMEINHLGATLVPSTKDGMSKDGGWKSLAASLFQKHQTFFARILAVDVPTKLVRLSMAPHVLNLGHATDPDSSLNGFPRMGTVVPDCTVIKLDPGIGVLLALPSQFNYTEAEVMISESLRKSSELFSDSTFQEACRVRKVYVHISKALDEAEEGEGKNSAFAGKFHKEFAPSTTHSVRILSTGHWIEGIAAGACAPSIVGAHVLSHDDLVAGKVYKQVPVCAHMQGGSILVQLGGAVQKRKKKKGDTHRGITGLIPPEQLFDTTSSGSSEYRKRVVQTKFAVDAKVDVRVLWVDPVRKKCLVTAKRTIVQAPTDQIITSYNDLKVGQVAVGFISRIDDDNMFVTFCNKVYGRVTARSLATELGVENHKENYCVGDAVSCRVVTLKRVYAKEQRSISSDDFETENAEESTIARTTSRPDYWELILSLKAKTANGEETISDAGNIDIQHPEQIRLLPGAILPKKSMKIVKLVDGRSKKAGGYTPGYAVVVIKSKYLMDESNPNRAKMTETVECKLPYDQLVDRYNPIDIQDVKTMDEMAMRLLVVGKKINQKGIVLLDPNKSNVEYSSGLGRMPVVSLRKQMIVAQEQQDGDSDADDDNMPIVPSPSTELFVGALVLGFVTHIDPRHGGFVRFLGGMTGLIPKKQGGLRLPLFNTVIARVKVIDDSFTPHRILLELHSDQNRVESDGAANESVEVGDELLHAKVSDVAFFQATFQVAGRKSKQEKFIMHCTSKEANASIIKHRKKPLSPDGSHRITKSHPFYGIEKGHEFGRLLVVGVKRRKNRVDVFVTDKNVDSDSVQDQDSSLHFIEDPLQLKTGMKTKAIVVGYAVENKGVIVQVGPSVRGFIPGLELSRDLNVLNNLAANIPLGAVLECRVLDRELWFRCRMSCPLPSFYLKQLKKGLGKKDLDHNSLYLSVLACDAQSRVPSRPSEGDLVIGRINRSLPQIQAPSLMIELRGGFVGRCCITELNEPDEWTNMPLGNPKRTATRNREEILDSQGENETDEKKDNTDDEKDLQDQM
jgi:S1 RNA binding domain